MKRPGESERQRRIREDTEKGYSQAAATGREAARQAGNEPLPAHGVDEPGTIGNDRPPPKAA